MSDLSTLYDRNAAFAETFDKGDLPIKPSLSTLILTCVDARVSPEHVAGVELGEALILRNVGARVTDTVCLEVAILWGIPNVWRKDGRGEPVRVTVDVEAPVPAEPEAPLTPPPATTQG